MRNEQEMFNLILSAAENDKRIRGVYMNGSRANPNAVKDIFQDYDIVYVVEETKSFREDRHWIDKFGERLYMQYPEENSYYDHDVDNCYGWLMQFTDGNRLDLSICTLSYALKELQEDSLYKVLLDKDRCLPMNHEATDKAYWVKRPTEHNFIDTYSDFWWCLNNVAKGLWRGEIPYVMDMINNVVRTQLIRLMEWKIGFQTDFTVSVGKSGKYMYRWLDKDMWNTFLKTYPSGEVECIWKSVFIMCDLFNDLAKDIAGIMNIEYNQIQGDNSLKFLKHVYSLPKDAEKIY